MSRDSVTPRAAVEILSVQRSRRFTAEESASSLKRHFSQARTSPGSLADMGSRRVYCFAGVNLPKKVRSALCMPMDRSCRFRKFKRTSRRLSSCSACWARRPQSARFCVRPSRSAEQESCYGARHDRWRGPSRGHGVRSARCSDGLEIRCDNGERVRVAFSPDCCDRQAIAFAAITAGISGELIRDVMVQTLVERYGPAPEFPEPAE